MEGDRGRSKKLRADRLTLLKYRVCARLRLSVEEFNALADCDRANFTALALLDGWGCEWQRLAATIHNASLRIAAASGAKVTDEMWQSEADAEAYRQLNPPDEQPAQEVDWAAAETMLVHALGLGSVYSH